MKYYDYFMNKFRNTIKEFNLHSVELSEESILLVSSKYALLFTVHFDNVYVEYIYRRENKLVSLDLSSFIASEFDEEDRRGVTTPKNSEETILTIINIMSSGIPRHFKTLLTGDIDDWIADYQEFELSKPPREVPENQLKILNNYF